MFPSVVGQVAVDTELVAEILRQSTSVPSEQGVNVGGWRSGSRIAQWPSAQATLDALLTLVVGAQSLDPWAVVHRAGSYHAWHRHSCKPWLCIGVMYLTTGGAATVFRIGGDEVRVEPVAGNVITFDPSIEHRTEPHHGGPRITIAFNASAKRGEIRPPPR